MDEFSHLSTEHVRGMFIPKEERDWSLDPIPDPKEREYTRRLYLLEKIRELFPTTGWESTIVLANWVLNETEYKEVK